jgi:hypothetical protein
MAAGTGLVGVAGFGASGTGLALATGGRRPVFWLLLIRCQRSRVPFARSAHCGRRQRGAAEIQLDDLETRPSLPKPEIIPFAHLFASLDPAIVEKGPVRGLEVDQRSAVRRQGDLRVPSGNVSCPRHRQVTAGVTTDCGSAEIVDRFVGAIDDYLNAHLHSVLPGNVV